MNGVIVVAGTDTGVGKTIVSAGLAQALGATYWKPVQAGLDDETDSELVVRLSGRPALPEAWRLALPASPHLAAEREGVAIAPHALALPASPRPLVVEAAGGVLTPLTRDTVYADVFASWGAPVVVVARTSLGTINHALLSLEALRSRGCHVAGVLFSGQAAPDSEAIICALGRCRNLGRLPVVRLEQAALASAFAQIDVAALRALMQGGGR